VRHELKPMLAPAVPVILAEIGWAALILDFAQLPAAGYHDGHGE